MRLVWDEKKIEQFKEMYFDQLLCVQEIADHFGTTPVSIKKMRHKNNIKTRKHILNGRRNPYRDMPLFRVKENKFIDLPKKEMCLWKTLNTKKWDKNLFRRNKMKEIQSQYKKILSYLEEGNTITQIDALEMFRCFRLASRIAEMRAKGHNIVTITKRVKSKDLYTGKSILKKIGEYKLIRHIK